MFVAGDEGNDDKYDEDPPEDADEAEGAPCVLETGLLQFHSHHPLACMPWSTMFKQEAVGEGLRIEKLVIRKKGKSEGFSAIIHTSSTQIPHEFCI